MSSVVVVEKDAKRVTMKQTLALVASSILVSGALYGVANPNLAPYCKAISPPLAEIPLVETGPEKD